MCIMRFAAKLTLPVIKGFDIDTVLFTPGLSCKAAGVTGMDDIKLLFMTDIGSDLVHVS